MQTARDLCRTGHAKCLGQHAAARSRVPRPAGGRGSYSGQEPRARACPQPQVRLDPPRVCHAQGTHRDGMLPGDCLLRRI